MRIAGVKLYENGMIEDFNAGALSLDINDRVLVKKDERIFLGSVAKEIINVNELLNGIPSILRKLNSFENAENFRHYPDEDEGFSFCSKKVKELGIIMKLLKVKFVSQENKMIFYYNAEERVDFRELVKILASKFHLRIEMRQINIRDECKLIGGIGLCGRAYCCNSFLKELAPITLKTAKFQSQNSGRMIGSCGRLICCFSFCSPDDKTCNCDEKEDLNADNPLNDFNNVHDVNDIDIHDVNNVHDVNDGLRSLEDEK